MEIFLIDLVICLCKRFISLKNLIFILDSPYRTAISGAVLKMQEEGKLHQLKAKWWKEMHGGGSCKVRTQTLD